MCLWLWGRERERERECTKRGVELKNKKGSVSKLFVMGKRKQISSSYTSLWEVFLSFLWKRRGQSPALTYGRDEVACFQNNTPQQCSLLDRQSCMQIIHVYTQKENMNEGGGEHKEFKQVISCKPEATWDTQWKQTLGWHSSWDT